MSASAKAVQALATSWPRADEGHHLEDTLQVLGDAAYEVSAATRASAVASGNKELVGRVDFPRSEVTSGRDPEIVALCQGIMRPPVNMSILWPTTV